MDSGRTGGERQVSSAAAAPGAAKGRLEGKIALITGGASGHGKATAHEFIQEGAAAVVIADVNMNQGLETAQELGPTAHFIHCDVTIEQNCT